MRSTEKTNSTSQDLTKLVLNNKIVELRKDVRQSRVHTINKLCREIKKLKAKAGTEEQKAKNLRKAEKFVQQVMLIKKIKDDDVTKFALQNENSLIKITNDVNETLENKALARLANHKGLAEKINEFRIAYPRWKDSLEYLLSTLGEKYKDKKFKKTSKSHDNIKLNKTSGEKPANVSQKLNSNTCFTNSSGRWLIEDIRHDQSSCNNNQTEHRKSKEISHFGNNETVTNLPCRDESLRKNDVSKEMNYFDSKEVITECANKTGTKDEPPATEPKIVNERLTSEDKIIPEDESTVKAAADPFFFTKDNKSYMSISVKDVQNDNEDFQNKSFHEKRRNTFFKNSYTDKKRKLDFNKNGRNFNSYEQNRKFKGNNPHVSKNTESKSEKSAPLHPSWEAKKKQSTGIQNFQFQGKKIKFEE